MKDAKLFFSYTKMIFVGGFWVFILLLVPGCSPIETQSMQNERIEDAELVTIREEGKQTFYTLNQEHIAVCCGQIMVKFAPESVTTENLLKTLKA